MGELVTAPAVRYSWDTRMHMQPQDLERIAKTVLRELGVGEPPLTITAEAQPNRWRLKVGGNDPATMTIRAGDGTTASHIREQIFTQFGGR